MKTVLIFTLCIMATTLYAKDGTDTFSYYDANGNYVTIAHMHQLPTGFDAVLLKEQLHFDSGAAQAAYPYRYFVDAVSPANSRTQKHYCLAIHYNSLAGRRKNKLFMMRVYCTPLKRKEGAGLDIIMSDSGYSNYMIWVKKPDKGKWRIKQIIFCSVEI